MKKITMICMAAMLLLAASCKKEKEEINEPVGEVSVFSVETEVHSGDSKTHLEGARVIWDSNDAINVINGNNVSKEFTFSKYVDGGDGSVAEFKAENLPADFYKPNYTGYYPSNFNPSSYSMLQTQTYSANGFVAGSNPMIATNEPKKLLHFKNVLGILELQLKSVDNSMAVKEIRVHSNNDEKLWGTGNVNANGEFVVTSGGSNTVKLNCGGITINSTTTTSFFILLPPGTLSGGFEVDVIDTDGEFWIKKTTNPNTIVRSRIKKMPEQSVKTGNCEDVQLWEGGPYWATKNLGAENPWNYGDYYQWGVSPNYYGDGIPTLYLSANKPPQTGTGSNTYNITLRTISPKPDGGYTFGEGYTYNAYCPYCKGTGDYASSFSNYLNTLQLENKDDIAYQLSGGTYHTPSHAELQDMYRETTHDEKMIYHGVNGRKYRGKGDYNDRFIFCPASGCVGTYNNGNSGSKTRIDEFGVNVYFWSSTRHYRNGKYYDSYALSDYEDGDYDHCDEYFNRWFGMPVRPIRTVTGN